MSKFCVIGSGISGATIANLLSKKHSVILFDKAKKKVMIVINKSLLGSNIIFFFSKKICFKNRTRKIKLETPK